MGAAHRSPASRAVGADLVERVDSHLQASGLLPRDTSITVALSGGLDSVALLDLLLALHARWGWTVSAAHFDHRMREESGSDAAWVKALCESRGVTCQVGRAPTTPRNEVEARELRYAFLREARAALGDRWLATAHQADDQAETVLFRLLSGSGLTGLAGIPARRPPHIVRPLLPFWRSEIEAYAHARGLAHLADPSNLDLRIARNRIRHRVIPAIEAAGQPNFRRDLYRLSDLARRGAAVVAKLTEAAAAELILQAAESRVVVARTGLLAYDTNARAHLLRALVARVGPRPGRIGTRIALKFINTGISGRAIDLAGGVVLRREFDRLIIERGARREVARHDQGLQIHEPRSASGDVNLGGVSWRVSWGRGTPSHLASCVDANASFQLAELDFPLTVRGWRAGDRIRLPGGTRKLKRVFADRRIGRSQRGAYPLLVDRTGVLWIVGLVQGARAVAADEGEVFSVGFRRTE